MNKRPFKPELLLLIVIPLLITFFGVSLYYRQDETKVVSRDLQMQEAFGDSLNQVFRIEGADEMQPAPATKPKSIGNRELSLALALIMGVAALWGGYMQRKWLWYIVISLALAFTILGSSYVGIKLTAFFLPNLLLAALITLIIGKLFFIHSLIRFRLILCSFLSAVAITLYYFLLFLFTSQPFGWAHAKAVFWNGIILVIFTTFGLTVADLILTPYRKKYFYPPLLEEDEEEAEDAE